MSKAELQLTPKERYKRIRQAREAAAVLVDFESPSGMVWKLRQPDMQLFISAGVLPLGLANKMAKAQKEFGGDEEEMTKALSTLEQIKLIEFGTALVRYVCVSPKIVDNPNPESDDEISPSEMEMDDYKAILVWAHSGGAAPGPQGFRG